MQSRSSFYIINRDRYFVFMAATAENKVTNGSKTFIALFDKLCTNWQDWGCLSTTNFVFQGTVTGYVYELLLFTSRQIGDDVKWQMDYLPIQILRHRRLYNTMKTVSIKHPSDEKFFFISACFIAETTSF
jgi:hypothetical protein